jgi:hypothetical protein
MCPAIDRADRILGSSSVALRGLDMSYSDLSQIPPDRVPRESVTAFPAAESGAWFDALFTAPATLASTTVQETLALKSKSA